MRNYRRPNCQILTYSRPYKPLPLSVMPTATTQENAQDAAGGLLQCSLLVCTRRSSQRTESVTRNPHVHGFILLLFALGYLGYCLCISFEAQVIPAFFPAVYARLPPHFATSPTCYSNHHQVYFEDLWGLFFPQTPPHLPLKSLCHSLSHQLSQISCRGGKFLLDASTLYPQPKAFKPSYTKTFI